MAELPSPIPSRAMIGRWNVDQYIDLLSRPVIIFSAVALTAALIQQPQSVIIVINFFGIGWIGGLVKRHSGRPVESLTSGAVIGLAMGLAASLGTFIVHPTLLDAIQGVSATLLTGLIGSLLTASIVLLLSFRKKT